MGISGAMVTSRQHHRPRAGEAARRCTGSARRPATATARARDAQASPDKKAHVRQIVTVLRERLRQRQTSCRTSARVRRGRRGGEAGGLGRVLGEFDQDPLDGAGVPGEPDRPAGHRRRHAVPPLRGHRLRRPFAQSFDRMKIVDGQAIPRGQRGFLFAKYIYEEQLKLKTARRLDKIKEAIESRRPDHRHGPRAAAHRAREQYPGARAPAPARRPQDRSCSAPSCRRSWAARRPTSASCWRRSSRPTTATSPAATSSSTSSWRRRWSCTGCGSATRLTIKAFTRAATCSRST